MQQEPKDIYRGVWPVMLTPFDERREIDWESLGRLVDWYIAAGVHGLFANCQSSEMFYLSDDESQRLTRFVVERAAGRVPVVASGHTACGYAAQVDQLQRMAESGAVSLILISNRLAQAGEGDDVVLANLQRLVAALPAAVSFGIYECPYPYKRLLSDEVVAWCAASGRFTFIKDTCCRIDVIRRRLELAKGSRLHIANANTATLLASLQAGAHGYSGVMANFHPALYVWLCENWQQEPAKALRLSDYLTTASLVETLDYPICAKDFQVSLGNFAGMAARVAGPGNYLAAHHPDTIRQVMRLGDAIAEELGISA